MLVRLQCETARAVNFPHVANSCLWAEIDNENRVPSPIHPPTPHLSLGDLDRIARFPYAGLHFNELHDAPSYSDFQIMISARILRGNMNYVASPNMLVALSQDLDHMLLTKPSVCGAHFRVHRR